MDTRLYEGIIVDRTKRIEIYIKNSTATLYNDYMRIKDPEYLRFY